jgi:hypothetical protein
MQQTTDQLPPTLPPTGPDTWQQPAVAAPETEANPAGIIMIVAAIAASAVGLVLPWLTAVLPFVGQISRSGLDTGDGKIIGIGLLFLAVVAWTEHISPNPVSKTILILGFAAIIAAIMVDYHDVAHRIADLNANPYGSASIGAGLYLCGAAPVAGIIGALTRI